MEIYGSLHLAPATDITLANADIFKTPFIIKPAFLKKSVVSEYVQYISRFIVVETLKHSILH